MLPTPLVKSLLMAASIGLVVPMVAQAPRAGRQTSTGDAQAGSGGVAGVERPWGDGIIVLAIEGNAFVLRFYTAEKEPAPVPVARAAVRWDPIGRGGTERTVLNPADDTLRSPSVVRPPHLFTAYVTLLDEAGNGLGTLSFDLRELP